jgi:hypothetical protein
MKNSFDIDQIKNKIFVHYGADKYDPNKFIPISDSNANWCKPEKGGLWASPVDSEWGWKDWCEIEGFREITSETPRFLFKLKESSRVLVVDTVNDAENKVQWKRISPSVNLEAIDFKKMMENWDAIYLTDKGQQRTRFTHYRSFYGC